MRRFLYFVLIGLFVVRHDLWLWSDDSLLLGLPVGLLYHALFCLVVSVVMALLVRHAWPELDVDDGDGDGDGAGEEAR